MARFDAATNKLCAKIVYYGPGLCGETTNLRFIHASLPNDVKGEMVSLATKNDRTLIFDFLPLELSEIQGMKTCVQLYTVPGQVSYNETRKLVLRNADGVVFVADSREEMMEANIASFRNLDENLEEQGLRLADIAHVLQFNKRDLPKLSRVEHLNASLNLNNAPFFESVATTGVGVQDSLNSIVKLVLSKITEKYDWKSSAVPEQPTGAGTDRR